MNKSTLALTKPIFICGPCAAESFEQIDRSAKEVSSLGIEWFRAGLWKPRTRPDCFQGVGELGLQWLVQAKKSYNIKVCTEVATPLHVEKCLAAGIDALWIGARTSTNPFSVEELSQSLKGVENVVVMVKNPIIADAKLWLGAIERVEKAINQTPIAIHRGFSLADNNPYRQTPLWRKVFELKQERSDLQIICDPSHIAGNSVLVKNLALEAANIGFDGLMIECHPNPDSAKTDAEQQLKFSELADILHSVNFPDNNKSSQNLSLLREKINQTDRIILDALAQRMQLSKSIAEIKMQENMSVFQADRWQEVMQNLLKYSKNQDLNSNFVEEVYQIIHQESIRVQNIIINKSNK